MWISSNRLYISSLIRVQCQQVSCQRNFFRARWSLPGLHKESTNWKGIFVWVETAWFSHFQDTDYCTVAQKVPCAQRDWWHLEIDWHIWKLSLFSICSKRGLLCVMQDHCQPCVAESTSTVPKLPSRLS